MCVIFNLDPNTMPNKEKFFNAVYNNWHSWGIVLKDSEGKLTMHKAVPENGENDPEFLYNLLEKHKDCQRVLHIRHTTKGATSLQNAQPFEIKIDPTRTAYFMHNGTLTGFGAFSSGPNDKSDTLEFVEKILDQSLPFWHGPNGKGDYTDPKYLKLVIDKQWTSTSTGLFVSNYCDILEYGNNWLDMPDSEGEGKIRVSNNSYFLNISRGPEYERRKAERMKKEAEQRSNRFQNDDQIYDYEDSFGYSYTPTRQSNRPTVAEFNSAALMRSEEIIDNLTKIHSDSGFGTYEGIKALETVTYDELAAFFENESAFSTAYTFEQLIKSFSELYVEYNKLKSQNSRMQKKLTTIHVTKGVEKNDVQEIAA